MKRRLLRFASRELVPLALCTFASAAAAADVAPPVIQFPAIDVVGVSPLPGIGNPLSQTPSNVQTFGAGEIGRQRLPGIAAFLEQNGGGVNAASPTGNSVQPDLTFRGFTASPLLGTPQGMSVFIDGVRVNEAFGDVVNWDTIPQNAIDSLQIVPGSNPLYGLNTLGGALVVTTKSGARDPGVEASVEGGSFGRMHAEAQAGGAHDGIDGFVAASAFDDDGWRDHSASRIRQLFARGGWSNDSTEIATTLTLADNTISGTQALPLPMLTQPKSAYTWPDTTDNELAAFSARLSHDFSDSAKLIVNAYARRFQSDDLNSNVNGNLDAANAPQAFNVLSNQVTNTAGAAMQAAWRLAATPGVSHQVVGGASYDRGDTVFGQSQQAATFVGDHDTVGSGAFEPGTDVGSTASTASAWLIDTLDLGHGASLSASARYNSAQVSIDDRSGLQPQLDGTHHYRKWLPALGATWSRDSRFTAFGNVSRGMRTPTPMELTCADPDAPCTLPNIFVSDPALSPVLATTFETGIRGRGDFASVHAANYSVALFRTTLDNDIQFISSGAGAVNAGYFRNVGRTRRQGVELFGSARICDFTLSARYTLLDATFRSAFREASPDNSTAGEGGEIDVLPGNRLPGIPRHTAKLRIDWRADGIFGIGASVVAQSSQYARGDENNADRHGALGGFAVANLDAHWQVSPSLRVYVRVENLFDRRYQNFGILGSDFFSGPGASYAPQSAAPQQFRSPGTPLGAWVGVVWQLGQRA